jgi:hypothetical protein
VPTKGLRVQGISLRTDLAGSTRCGPQDALHRGFQIRFIKKQRRLERHRYTEQLTAIEAREAKRAATEQSEQI